MAKNNLCKTTEPDGGEKTYKNSVCDLSAGKCDVVKKYGEDSVVIPICTEAVPVPCINSSCTAMVCGPINYVPNPFKSEKSAADLYGDATSSIESNKPMGAFAELTSDSVKLYQGTCKFLPVDNFFKYVFENTEGSYVNTFRFGFGSSLTEYARSSPYFPITDYYCGLNGKGTVDRYMNYLVGQAYFNSYLKTFHPNKPSPLEQFLDPKHCLVTDLDMTDIHLYSEVYGGHNGEYLTNSEPIEKTIELEGIEQGNSESTMESSLEEKTYTVPPGREIDSEFYGKALRFLYDKDIQSTGKAPYECETATECMSGNCGFSNYLRSVCSKKDGTFTECLCKKEEFDQDLATFVMNCESKTIPTFNFGNSVTLNRQTIEDAANTQIELQSTFENYDPSAFVKYFSLPVTGEIVFREFKEEEIAAMHTYLPDTANKQVIGYATPDNFGDTAIAKGCELVSGTDYKTYEGGMYIGVPGAYTQQMTSSGMGYKYPSKYTLIFSLGNCEPGLILDTAPNVKQFGWCEPCTLSTMARAEVYGELDESGVTQVKAKTLDFLKSDVLPVMNFPNSYWKEIDDSTKSVEDLAKGEIKTEFIIIPGSFSNGWVSSSKLVYFKEKTKIQNFLSNDGPYIVVLGSVEHEWDPAIIERTKRRAEFIRTVCDRCITSFDISTRGSSLSATNKWNTQFAGNVHILRNMFGGSLVFEGCYDELGNLLPKTNPDHCDEDMLNLIDILLFDFYPADVSDWKPEICTDDDSQYDEVIDSMEEMGYATLNLVHKPSLIYNFGFKKDSCWKEENMKAFTKYMIQNQDRLTKSGIIGMLYSEYAYGSTGMQLVDGDGLSSEDPYDIKSYKFCVMQNSLNLLGGRTPVYSYLKRYVSEDVSCVEKDDSQRLKEITGLTVNSLLCANNVQCKLPPLPEGKTADDYMCPPSTIASPCKKCSTVTGKAECSYEYSDPNLNKEVTISPSSLSDPNLYPDILSSLPPDMVCCIEDQEDPGNLYTYIKVGADSNYHAPVIYSSYGNPEEDCGVYSKSDEDLSCTASASEMLKNYKVDCKKV